MDYNILEYNEYNGHYNISNTLLDNNSENGWYTVTTDSETYVINSFVKWMLFKNKDTREIILPFNEVCSLFNIYTSIYFKSEIDKKKKPQADKQENKDRQGENKK